MRKGGGVGGGRGSFGSETHPSPKKTLTQSLAEGKSSLNKRPLSLVLIPHKQSPLTQPQPVAPAGVDAPPPRRSSTRGGSWARAVGRAGGGGGGHSAKHRTRGPDGAISASREQDVQSRVQGAAVDAAQVAVVVPDDLIGLQVPALDHLVVGHGEQIRGRLRDRQPLHCAAETWRGRALAASKAGPGQARHSASD